MARFQKGQSGNPSGRPKGIGEVMALALAILALAQIVENEESPQAGRVAAANAGL